MAIKKFLKMLVDQDASDLFLRAGGIPRLRLGGKVVPLDEPVLTMEEVMQVTEELTTLKQREVFKNNLDVDFAIYLNEFNRRFRVSVFMQRNWPSIVIRNVRSSTQTFEDLNLPAEVLKSLASERSGLVLLTGSMGSGKSTTIASMIEYINSTANKHILTLEEPIEFTFSDKKSIINQRELGIDVTSYATALRTSTLQSPDVIYIANIRDAETMNSAMTAAETGVLVLSTLHTVNAPKTVERIVNFFPPHEHQEIKNRLSSLLKGVISLRLTPKSDGSGRVPAYEVMLLTPTISRLIRESKVWEIPQYIEEGGIFGMQSFTQSLVKLVRENKVSEEDAAGFSDNKEEFNLVLRGIKKS
jgi:twitching motility protein PilT